MKLDRSALNRALAKAIAHRQAGNNLQAQRWAAHLLYLLDVMDIADQRLLDELDAGTEPAK